MGIAISELLTLEYFKEFRVLAGHRGLHREVQGVTVLDAPDSFRWTRGKEMILSSGYVIAQEPDCLQRCLLEGFFPRMACMVVKAGRYLTPIPAELLALFEAHDIPFLEAPFSVAYMDLMHQVNIAIMNKTTKRFCISDKDTYILGDDSYKERKLRRILQAVEVEMGFPALLYDVAQGESYFSSPNFRSIADSRRLTLPEFWTPDFPHSRHTLCDSLHMVRYRMQEDAAGQPRFSWITVPIAFSGSVQAYFVVLESRELIDYYDEYALRIATLLLQAVYEQLIVARNVGNIGFENLMHFAIRCGEETPQQLITQAGALNLNINQQYDYAVLHQTEPGLDLGEHRTAVWDELRLGFPGETTHFAVLSRDQCLILLRHRAAEQDGRQTLLAALLDRLEARFPAARFHLGRFGQPGTILEAARSISRCRQALRLGELLYPGRRLWSYEEFGPLAWLELREGELDMMCREYQPLLSDPKNQELLHTLKVYLASNMNYSDTAEKLYVHINTIRKRIERVNDLLSIDWQDSFTRMKLELLLQLLHI